MDDVSFRAAWRTGAACEIYSDSMLQWFQGEICDVFRDEEGEWLEVKYHKTKSRQVQRYSRDIRPHPVDMKFRELIRLNTSCCLLPCWGDSGPILSAIRSKSRLLFCGFMRRVDHFYINESYAFPKGLSDLIWKYFPQELEQETPLLTAVHSGYLSVILSMLLKVRGDSSAMQMALNLKHYLTVHLLTQMGVRTDRNHIARYVALKRAFIEGNDDMVDVLLLRASDWKRNDGRNPRIVEWAIFGNHVEYLKRLMKANIFPVDMSALGYVPDDVARVLRSNGVRGRL